MNQSIGNLESRGTTTSDTQLGKYMLSQKNWPLISPLTSEARNFQLGIWLADSPAGMPHMDCGALFLLFFKKINFSFFFGVFQDSLCGDADCYCRPILHKYANEDVSLGAWFIGLEVELIDDRNMCCGTPPGIALKISV
jgi:hypothetical protein